MKHLSKEQDAKRGELVADLRGCEGKIEEAEGAVTSALEALNARISEYNDKVGEAEAWCNEVSSDMQSYMDDKSEKWAEGDSGTEYSDWKDTYDGISFDVVEERKLDDLPEFTLAQELEDLPDQPG